MILAPLALTGESPDLGRLSRFFYHLLASIDRELPMKQVREAIAQLLQPAEL